MHDGIDWEQSVVEFKNTISFAASLPVGDFSCRPPVRLHLKVTSFNVFRSLESGLILLAIDPSSRYYKWINRWTTREISLDLRSACPQDMQGMDLHTIKQWKKRHTPVTRPQRHYCPAYVDFQRVYSGSCLHLCCW